MHAWNGSAFCGLFLASIAEEDKDAGNRLWLDGATCTTPTLPWRERGAKRAG
jgi:hypothetical protein